MQGQPVVGFSQWLPHYNFLEPLTNPPLRVYDIRQEINLKGGKSEKLLLGNRQLGHHTALLWLSM